MDPTPNDDDLVKQLLAVKRHEKPKEEYYENFLTEFKDRQRSEMLSQSARGLLAERVSTWWWDGGSKWAYGAGAVTAAAVAMGVMLNGDPAISENAVANDNDGNTADFRMTLPKPDVGAVTPPLSPTSSQRQHGFIPVSASSLQEL